MKALIIAGGVYNIILAVFHSAFWKLFDWGNELERLSALNKAVMQGLNIQIIWYFVFTAAICFAFPTQLRSTKLGRCFLLGTAMFWLIRTAQQFIFFRTEDASMYVLAAFFLLGTALFLVPVLCMGKRA